MGSSGAERHARWVADPGVGWRILLGARLSPTVPADLVAARFAELCSAQGWGTAPAPLTDDDLERLCRRMTAHDDAPVRIGHAPSGAAETWVVSAHHSAVDGLGLLRVLGEVTGAEIVSHARGVGDRPTAGRAASAIARRLAEAALHPAVGLEPDTPATSWPPADEPDVLATTTVPGRIRTAELVAAGAAVAGARSPRGPVAVAVGATRDNPTADRSRPITEDSVLLRLRDARGLTVAEIDELLRTRPLEARPAASSRPRPWDGASRAALRLLAPRLGSTLLVSHLGRVTAPGVEHAFFHPVTAGGSGVSLGAITLDTPDDGPLPPRTVIGLRARASRWGQDALDVLLEEIVGVLA